MRITADLSHGTGMHEDKQLAVELPDGSTTKDSIAKVQISCHKSI